MQSCADLSALCMYVLRTFRILLAGIIPEAAFALQLLVCVDDNARLKWKVTHKDWSPSGESLLPSVSYIENHLCSNDFTLLFDFLWQWAFQEIPKSKFDQSQYYQLLPKVIASAQQFFASQCVRNTRSISKDTQAHFCKA